MSGCLSSPDSIIEWAPRKWNKPSDTIQAVRGLCRGVREGDGRHVKWIGRWRTGNLFKAITFSA